MKEQVQQILAKHLSGECTQEEMVWLQEWLKVEENQAELEALQTNWDAADELFEAPNFHTQHAWQKVAAQTIHKSAAVATQKIQFPSWLKVALPAASTIALGFFLFKGTTRTETITLTATQANQEFTLPDESKILLRKGSALQYEKNFEGKERNLTLTGDARFKVTRNEQKPFIVRTDNASITVLGTAFDVHATNQMTTVAVTSGRVSVQNEQAEAVVLTAHQQAIVQPDGIVKDTLLHNNQIFWQTQALAFSAHPLHKVISEIAQATQTDISLDKDLSDVVKNQKITISFKSQQVEEMLTELCLIAKCNWHKQGSKYLVRTK